MIMNMYKYAKIYEIIITFFSNSISCGAPLEDLRQDILHMILNMNNDIATNIKKFSYKCGFIQGYKVANNRCLVYEAYYSDKMQEEEYKCNRVFAVFSYSDKTIFEPFKYDFITVGGINHLILYINANNITDVEIFKFIQVIMDFIISLGTMVVLKTKQYELASLLFPMIYTKKINRDQFIDSKKDDVLSNRGTFLIRKDLIDNLKDPRKRFGVIKSSYNKIFELIDDNSYFIEDYIESLDILRDFSVIELK